jgi:cobalt-precorrin 5A hydrolase
MTARAIGFGASTLATVADILELVRTTSEAAPGTAPFLVATVDVREEMGRDVAAALGCKLVVFSAAELAHTATAAGLSMVSVRAAGSVGTPSVAEASALAALGPTASLVVARRTGRRCTCAIAEVR